MRNADESNCAAEDKKSLRWDLREKISSPPQILIIQCIHQTSHRGVCLHQLRDRPLQLPLHQISAVSEEEQGGLGVGDGMTHSEITVSCAFGGKKCLPVFWGVITIIKSHTTRAQTMQRTVLIVFPTACKAEQDLANSDCSAKKKPQRQSFGLAS